MSSEPGHAGDGSLCQTPKRARRVLAFQSPSQDLAADMENLNLKTPPAPCRSRKRHFTLADLGPSTPTKSPGSPMSVRAVRGSPPRLDDMDFVGVRYQPDQVPDHSKFRRLRPISEKIFMDLDPLILPDPVCSLAPRKKMKKEEASRELTSEERAAWIIGDMMLNAWGGDENKSSSSSSHF